MNLEFSFIVPAYNCKRTIERTLTSIIDDTIKAGEDSYEVIIVENGSDDGTYDFCKELANKDSHIKILRSSKGVSAARNVGLEATAANWIIFVDADDKWLEGSLKRIRDDITAYDSDLFVYGFKKGDKEIRHASDPILYTGDRNIEACSSWLIKRPTLRMQVWGKVYKNNQVQKNKLRFNESLSFSEDGDFLIRYIIRCSRIFVSNEVIYEYITDTDSATRNNNKEMWGNKTRGYTESMEMTQNCILNASKEIKRAFAEYVLIHLNLIMVRDIFEVKRKCSWKKRSEEMRVLIETKIFADALNQVNLRECLNMQLLPEFFFKTRFRFGGGY